MDNFLGYVTLHFKTRLKMYRSLLYVKVGARYKRKTDHVENGALWFFAYISHLFSRTAVNDILLDAFRKGEWHRLENFPVRSIFHREKRGKRNIQSLTCTVFHVFYDEEWNETENLLAYVTLHFKTRLKINRLLLYVKIDARCKQKTDHVENGTLWFFRLYLASIFTYRREQYVVRRILKRRVSYSRKFSGPFHFPSWKTEPFYIVESVEYGRLRNQHPPFSTFFMVENEIVRIIDQFMPLFISKRV